MRKLSIYIIIITLCSSCVSYDDYPPQKWWYEQASFEDIEQQHDEWCEPIILASIQVECAEWSAPIISDSGFTRKNCLEYIKLSKDELEEKHREVAKNNKLKDQVQWKKFKNHYLEGDSIYRYSAPPLSGGFGVVLVRNNKVVAFYELGSS